MTRPSILIVENHVDTAEAAREFLEFSGFNVQVAGDLRSARNSLARNMPDAIICDIGLPDGTGWDLMADLPSPKPLSIAISGLAREADAALDAEAGFSHRLNKPFATEQLLALLEPLVSRKSPSA